MTFRKWVGVGAVVCALSAIYSCSGSSDGDTGANGGTSNNNAGNGNGSSGSGNGSSGSGNGSGSSGSGNGSLEDPNVPDAGGQSTMPTPPTDGCYLSYRLESDVTCDANSPLSCNQATWVSVACTDGRVYERRCSGDTTSGCQCACGLQGGDDVATCTTEPSCFGSSTCSPQGCDEVDGAQLLDCCSDADCITGMPYCRDGFCAADETAGAPTTSCEPEPVDLCASVSCGPGHTCVDGNCFCGKNPPCARAETCADDICYCGNNPACGAGMTCFNGGCQ